MRLPIYQIDAFAARLFAGNPAAVVPLDGAAGWPPDALMQSIAAENNLAETAFFLYRPGDTGPLPIRWFTPNLEIDLCGHATVASAWVLFERLEPGRSTVTFSSQSGPLSVARDGDRLALDFPARPPEPCTPETHPELGLLAEALGGRPVAFFKSRDFLVRYGSEAEVRALRPDFKRLAAVDTLGIIATAVGEAPVDFVSRFFAPAAAVDEDPVTGSAHCTLIPFWSARLGKDDMLAHQVSPRGGELFCAHRGARVTIAGRAVPYLEGFIEV